MEKSVKESVNETESDEDEEHCSENLRITDIYEIEKYLTEFVVCKWCNSEIEIDENLRVCTGLGTTFPLYCKNMICISHEKNGGFHNTKNDGQIYKINRKSILASEIIGKGRKRLLKLYSVIGLSDPVCKQIFTEHTRDCGN